LNQQDRQFVDVEKGDVIVNTFIAMGKKRTSKPCSVVERNAMQNIAAHYHFREILGQGTSGTVRAGVHKKTGRRFAIKTISIKYESERKLPQMKIVRDLRREVACLKLVRTKGKDTPDCSHLLQLVQVYEWRPNSANIHECHIVTELCEGGDLRRLIDARRNGASGRFSNAIMQGLTCQLLWALEVIHSKGMVHRDVKPGNIVLRKCLDLNNNASRGSDDVPFVKLIDMGITESVDELRQLRNTSGYAGTTNYVAPEVVSSQRYSAASDVWAAGIVLYELACGRLPFAATMEDQWLAALRELEMGQEPIAVRVCDKWSDEGVSVSRELVHLLQAMLCPDPTKRLTISAALAHPWFHGFTSRFHGSLGKPVSGCGMPEQKDGVATATGTTSSCIPDDGASKRACYAYFRQALRQGKGSLGIRRVVVRDDVDSEEWESCEDMAGSHTSHMRSLPDPLHQVFGARVQPNEVDWLRAWRASRSTSRWQPDCPGNVGAQGSAQTTNTHNTKAQTTNTDDTKAQKISTHNTKAFVSFCVKFSNFQHPCFSAGRPRTSSAG